MWYLNLEKMVKCQSSTTSALTAANHKEAITTTDTATAEICHAVQIVKIHTHTTTQMVHLAVRNVVMNGKFNKKVTLKNPIFQSFLKAIYPFNLAHKINQNVHS